VRARLDAATDPCFFDRELAVEQRVLLDLDAALGVARLEVAIVVARVAA